MQIATTSSAKGGRNRNEAFAGFDGDTSEEDGDEGGIFIIAVQNTGRIFTMDTDFHIGEADLQYMAEGAGQELCLGSLYSTNSIKTPRRRIRMALEAAAKFNMSVRPPFTIIEV